MFVATTLPVYKPRGMAAFGWRKQQQQRMMLQPQIRQIMCCR
jgi:hypothetical protein